MMTYEGVDDDSICRQFACITGLDADGYPHKQAK